MRTHFFNGCFSRLRGGARILARDHADRNRKSLENQGDINHILLQVVEACVYYTEILKFIHKKMFTIGEDCQLIISFLSFGLGSRVSVCAMKGLVSVWMSPILCACKLTLPGQTGKCEGIIQA